MFGGLIGVMLRAAFNPGEDDYINYPMWFVRAVFVGGVVIIILMVTWIFGDVLFSRGSQELPPRDPVQQQAVTPDAIYPLSDNNSPGSNYDAPEPQSETEPASDRVLVPARYQPGSASNN